MNVDDFLTMKCENRKITVITCYDYWSARIIDQSNVDCVLVGDSLAMVMHGHSTTIPATVDIMALHTQAVVRGAKTKLVISDMPFLSYRKSKKTAMQAVQQIMQAGAHAIKLEGVDGNADLIRYIVDSGVPVMGHIGLTPQSIHQLGGYKVQGRSESQAKTILKQAKLLDDAGCFSIVLECVPNNLAKQITDQVSIPTIGIGAGPNVSGQVLVLQDMLGMNESFNPKFLKTYFDGFNSIKNALNEFDMDVKSQHFPSEVHYY